MLPVEQCLRNVRAWLEWVGAPPLELIVGLEDRCYFENTEEFDEWLKRESADGYARFHKLGNSYREQVPCTSAEITVGGYFSRVLGRTIEHVVEIDFDYYNPDYGLFYMLLHGIEVLKNKLPWRQTKTDPVKIAKGLRKRGIEV